MRSLTLLVAAFFAAGCAGVAPDGELIPAPGVTPEPDPAADSPDIQQQAATPEPPPATPEPPTDAEAEDAVEAPALEAGTRDAPLPLGTAFTIGDWTVSVLSVEEDAWEEIEAENQFNDPPADGRQFVMFRVSMTYDGEDSGNPWLDVSWAIVGSAGNTFGTGTDDWCGVIPDPLSDRGETFPGGSVEGNECVSIESDQLDGATIRVEGSFLTDDRVFVALE